jgi:GNAT superfamily N-acetyltransferase
VELTGTLPSWSGVVSELRRSCLARAHGDDVLDLEGAVGVLRGTAPVVWLHAAQAADEVARLLCDANEVREVYAGAELSTTALLAHGWRAEGELRQLVRALPTDVPTPPYEVCELGPADVPAFVAGLQRTHGLSDIDVAQSYPPDFLVRAAPVRLFGVRHGDDLLAAVATRRPFSGALVFGLWVAPAERGRGLARAVVGAAARAEQDSGAAFLHAQVSGLSRGLMISLGWQDCGGWQYLTRSATPNG